MKHISLFLLVILLSISFYGGGIKDFPLDIYRLLYVFSFVMFVYLLFVNRYWIYWLFCGCGKWQVLLFLLALSCFFSILVYGYTGFEDFTFIRMHIDYFLTFLVVVPVFCYYLIVCNKFDIKQIIYFLMLMGGLQSLMMLAMLLFPDFQKIVFNFIDTNGAIVRFDSEYRFRAIGFTGFASYAMAVTQSFLLYLSAIFLIFLTGWREFFLKIPFFFIILLSCILSARTSFIFIIPLYVLLFARSAWFLKSISARKSFVLLLLSGLLVIGFFAFIKDSGNETYERMIYWAFEIFYSLSSSGGINTDSTDALKTLFFLPSLETFVYGDGKYLIDGEYYMNTDVGYLRVLLYGGWVGSLLFYSIFICLFYVGIIYTRRIINLQAAVMIGLYFLMVFIVNIKGSIFFDGFSAIKFITFYTFSVMWLSERKFAFQRAAAKSECNT